MGAPIRKSSKRDGSTGASQTHAYGMPVTGHVEGVKAQSGKANLIMLTPDRLP